MYAEEDASAVNPTQVIPEELALMEVRQRYSGAIRQILSELHALLPRYGSRVNPARYAYDQNELMALTVDYCGGSSDLAELEALFMTVKRQQQAFTAALGLPPERGFVADDQPVCEADVLVRGLNAEPTA